MHFGHIGLRQTKQCSTENSPLCFGHGCPSSFAAAGGRAVSVAVPCVAVEAPFEMDNLAAAAGATVAAGAACAIATRIFVDLVAGAGCGAGVGCGTGAGMGAVYAAVTGTIPSSCRIKSLIGPDRSRLHEGQTNRTGSRAISGVTSIAYLDPQLHWTFITTQGLGFNKTTGGVNIREIVALPAVEITLPSHIKKLPPPLP